MKTDKVAIIAKKLPGKRPGKFATSHAAQTYRRYGIAFVELAAPEKL